MGTWKEQQRKIRIDTGYIFDYDETKFPRPVYSPGDNLRDSTSNTKFSIQQKNYLFDVSKVVITNDYDVIGTKAFESKNKIVIDVANKKWGLL